MYEIIYVCNSINNRNVREGELNILEKHENQLYFEFGSDEMNIKKRFYNDVETLNKDFDNLLKLKDNKEEFKEENAEENAKTKEISESIEELNEEIDKEMGMIYKKDEEINKKELKKESRETESDKYKIIKRKR